MNRKKLLLLFSIFLTSCCETPPFKIINLGEAKNAVQSFYESGGFDKECSLVIEDAISHVESIKLTNKSAVVFDIDETSLSNYDYTKQIGFGYINKLWVEWQLKGEAPAIRPVKQFYDYLVSKKIHIIFLTGRTSEVKDATRKNLINQGFTNFDTLIVRSQNETKIPSAEFKAKKREALVKNGYDIIASIGDQWSDLVGGNAGYKIKLPSYLYLLD